MAMAILNAMILGTSPYPENSACAKLSRYGESTNLIPQNVDQMSQAATKGLDIKDSVRTRDGWSLITFDS